MSYQKTILLVLALFVVLHIPTLLFPNYMVFDENIYINAAHQIMSGDVNWNFGQPPLAKDIFVLSILFFGDNMPIGAGAPYRFAWGFPSLVFGTLTLLLFYRIIRKLTNNGRVALFSTALLSFDNFYFIHSAIGTLDIFFIFFMMLSIDLYLNFKPNLSAVSSGLALVAKFFSIFGVLIIGVHVLFDLVRSRFRSLRERAIFLTKYVAVTLTVFLITLVVLDLISYRSPADPLKYWNPLNHISAMFGEHTSMTMDKVLFIRHLNCSPWFWFYGCKPLPYYVTNIDGGYTIPIINFWFRYYLHLQYFGTATLPIVALGLISLPYLVYDIYRNRSRASLFMLIWFCVCYFFWWPIALANRIMFIYYLLPSIPAICYADIRFLDSVIPSRQRTIVICAFLLLCFVYFAWFLYPVRLINIIW